MRKISLFIALLLINSVLSAQSVKLYFSENYVKAGEVNADTITIDYTTYGIDHSYWLYVENTTEESIDVIVTKTILDTVPGSNVYFCWGECVSSSVYVSDPREMSANESLDFQAEYLLNSGRGTSYVRYTFSNANDADDAVSIVLAYRTTVGIAESQMKNISVYPNPVMNKLYIGGLTAQSKASLYDILGNCIIAETTDNNIDMSALPAGIYMLRIAEGNKIITRKVIKK
ncbi:MAG: T9SS type A sorting domain-containing protein [Bacteroidales bacterium]|nr:T9SS type A sorting domain-containing protein [Bacteroidales bacterium]